MLFKKLIQNIFTIHEVYVDNVSYRRLIMVNNMLVFGVAVFYFFTCINIFIMKNYTLALLDFSMANTAILIFYMFRRIKNLKVITMIMSIMMITFVILFILKNQNNHFGIIWSILIPILTISFNGRKIGLILSFVFYSILFYLAYKGIGIWSSGKWTFIDFARLVSASLLLMYIVYARESSNDKADKKLKEIRKHEAQMLQKIKIQAITDGLTRMYNRRYFNEIVPKILGIAGREKTCVSFFILDVDYFKKYNDHYGYKKGDEVLQAIAKELMNFIQRDGDFVFRVGGEEFAGIIHTKDVNKSKKWISKINKNIQALNIPHEASLLDIHKVTVSIGICSAYVDADKDINYFYKKADMALYQAKKSRNSSVFIG